MTVMKSNQAGFYRLEDRVLFEAGAVVQAAEAAAAESGANAEIAVEAETAAQNDVQSDIADLASVELPPEVIAETAAETAESEPAKVLVVINSSVADAGKIVNDLGENYEILRLETGTDALDTINAYLDAHSDTSYSALHIVSHGNDGFITLNGEKIDNSTLNPADWKAIGEHLTDDADILIYGCNTAKSDEGKALVQTIADLTGADVAASTDTTGATGNWNMEYKTGLIEAATLSPDGYEYSLEPVKYEYIVSDTGEYTTINAALSAAQTDAKTCDGTFTIKFDGTITTHTADTVSISGFDSGDTLVVDGAYGEDQRFLLEGNGKQAIKVSGAGNFTFQNLVVQNARGGQQGGAFSIIETTGKLTFDNVLFESNEANYGGGIFSTGTGELNITNSVFQSNFASWGGGAIYSKSAKQTISLNTVEFIANTADRPGDSFPAYSGGAIYTEHTGTDSVAEITAVDVTFTGTDIADTTIASYGGAIYIKSAGTLDLSITGTSSFTNHQVSKYGGAISIDITGTEESIVTMTDVAFDGNTTSQRGGAIYFSNAGSGELKISASAGKFSTFKNNTSGQHGGAIGFASAGTSLTIENTCFDTNTATTWYGGAIYAETVADLTVKSSVFRNHSAQYGGGAIFVETAKNVLFRDGNIFQNNKITNMSYNGGAICIYTAEEVDFFNGNTFIGAGVTDVAQKGGAVYLGTSVGNVNISYFSAEGLLTTNEGSVICYRGSGKLAIDHATVINSTKGVYLENRAALLEVSNSIFSGTAGSYDIKYSGDPTTADPIITSSLISRLYYGGTNAMTTAEYGYTDQYITYDDLMNKGLYLVQETIRKHELEFSVASYLARSQYLDADGNLQTGIVMKDASSAIGATPSEILWVLSPEITTEEQTKTYGDIAVSDPVFTGVQILTENGGLSGLSMSVKYTLTANAGDAGSLDVGNYTAKTAYTGLSAEGYTSKAKDGILYLTDNKNTYYYLVSTPAEKAVSVKVNPAEITSGTVTWSETLKLGTADGTSKLTSDLLTGFTSTDILDEDAASFLATITLAAASGDFIAAGAHTAKIGGTTNGNYTFTDDFLKSQTAKSPEYTIIDKLTVSVSMTSNDDNNDGIITYGETVTLKAEASGGESGYTYQWYSDNGVIFDATGESYEIINAGTGNYWVVVTDSASNIADSTLDTKSVEIQKAVATVTIKDMNITYGETVTVSAGASGVNSETVSGQFVYEYYEADQTTKLASAPVNAGTYYVKAFFTSENSNYADMESDYTLVEIAPDTPTVAITGLVDGKLSFIYGDTVSVSATASADNTDISGNGTISYVYYRKDRITEISGMPVNAGTYYVKACFTSNSDNYTDSESGLIELNVKQRTITAEAYSGSLTYNGSEQGLSVKLADGSINQFAAADHRFEVTDSDKETDAGTYTDKTVTFKIVDENNTDVSANYDFTATLTGTLEIAAKAVTVKVSGETAEKVYDGNEYTAGFTFTCTDDLFNKECTESNILLNGQTISITGTNVADSGILTLTVDKLTCANTNFAVTFTVEDGAEKVELAITPKPVSVDWTGEDGSGTDFEWVYTGDTFKPAAKLDTGIDGETAGIIVETDASGNGAGEYTAAAVISGNGTFKADNYSITGLTQTYKVINAALNVTAENVSGTADGSGYSVAVNAATVDGTGAVIVYGTTDGDYSLTESPVFTEAGTYTVYYQVSAANHNTVTGSATVTLTALPDPVPPPSDPVPVPPPVVPENSNSIRSEATQPGASGQSSLGTVMMNHSVMGIGSGNSVMISSTETQNPGAAGLLFSMEYRNQLKRFEETSVSVHAEMGGRGILLSDIIQQPANNGENIKLSELKCGETAVSDHLNGVKDARTEYEEKIQELETLLDHSGDFNFSDMDFSQLTVKAGQFRDDIDLALEEMLAV